MLTYYRGHVIVLLVDTVLTAEITELATGTPLPTKVTATLPEGADVCITRAKMLVDIYLKAPGSLER